MLIYLSNPWQYLPKNPRENPALLLDPPWTDVNHYQNNMKVIIFYLVSFTDFNFATSIGMSVPVGRMICIRNVMDATKCHTNPYASRTWKIQVRNNKVPY